MVAATTRCASDLLHRRAKFGQVGSDDLAQLLKALQMTSPDSSGVEQRRVLVPEPDQDVLWHRLQLASVVVVGIDGDVDAARPGGPGRGGGGRTHPAIPPRSPGRSRPTRVRRGAAPESRPAASRWCPIWIAGSRSASAG